MLALNVDYDVGKRIMSVNNLSSFSGFCLRRRQHEKVIFPAKSGAVFVREFFRQCANFKNEWRQILTLCF